jgi:hypothetical protein
MGQFSKEVWMANKYMKNCRTSLGIKEMQIKTTLRFHPTPVDGNHQENKQQMQRKRILIHCWWKCNLVQIVITIVISVEVHQKPKIDLPYYPGISLLGIYLKKCKFTYKMCSCTPTFITTLVTIAKWWNQSRCPTNKEWRKMWHIYIHIYIHTHAYAYIYLYMYMEHNSHKEWNYVICRKMHGAGNHHFEWEIIILSEKPSSESQVLHFLFICESRSIIW